MFHSTMGRVIVGVVAVLAVLALLRFKPWKRLGGDDAGANLARQSLNVGFLPVT
jgi:hypothetical protein